MLADRADDSLLQKARRIRMVIMDCDGVLTDGKAMMMSIHAVPRFQWTVRLVDRMWEKWGSSFWHCYDGMAFCVQDGSGIKYLHRSGLRTAILSGRRVGAVQRRARVLGIEDVVLGSKVKLEGYAEIMGRHDISDEEVAYVGDDLPDIPVMRRVGLGIAVANAVPEVLETADAVTDRTGGNGAVREIAESILKAQGKWDAILSRYFDSDS